MKMTEELPHIRCYECGNVLGNKWTRYQNYLTAGLTIEQALNKLGLSRYCCRGHMMNPIKVPVKSGRQIDPRQGLETKTEQLSVATGPTPVLAPLEVLKIDASRSTIVPITSGIDLPPVPEVSLATVSTPGVIPEQKGQVIRSYQAW